MKRILSILAALTLTLCAMSASAETYTIGIGQFAEHGSLDNCRTGFIEGLAEAGLIEGENLEIVYQNAQADMGIAQQIAAQFAAMPVDLMVGIATPMAQACYNAADGAIPTIYTAVSDPVEAGFADSSGAALGNATGTSDMLPVQAQLSTIRAMLPDAKTIGILYTTSEPNSVSTIAEYQEKAPDYGFTIDAVGVTSQAEVTQAADTVLSHGVDAMSNLTDNNVVGVLPAILEKANEAGVPIYGSEVEQVKLGCVASAGIDYVQLGKQTGLMAAKVLRGEATCAELPYETISEYSIYINSPALSAMGISVPADIAETAVESSAQ